MNDQIKNTIFSLRANGFKATFFPDEVSARTAIIKECGSNNSIGVGGSQTILDLNIYHDLVAAKNSVYWHWMCNDKNKSCERKNARTADIYIYF